MTDADRIREQMERSRRIIVTNEHKAAACSADTGAGRNSAKYHRAKALLAQERLASLQMELAKIEGVSGQSRT